MVASTDSTRTRVSVIGTGAMGSALAGRLLDSGYAVTVWNRSAEKARPLTDRGAVLAASFARIFLRNAINLGLPAVVCPEAVRQCQAGDELEVAKGSAKHAQGSAPVRPTRLAGADVP